MAKIYGNTTATPIPLTVVDQNYSADSTNAQSGKAVALAIKSKADAKTEDGGFSSGLDTGTYSGGAIGKWAASYDGGAVGDTAESFSGFAGGANAYSIRGGAVGSGAVAGNGFSGGAGAQVDLDENEELIDAIQLGTGTNSNPKTLQVYSHTLMNADGTIPEERLTKAKAYTDEKIGDIETALDTIIAMQNELTGGVEV